MLTDRITKSNEGFHITKEKNAPPERKVFFGIYSFKEDAGFIPVLQEINYWKAMSEEIKVDEEKQEALIYVVEKNGEKIEDEARFYWSRMAGSNEPKLIIRTSRADKKYGEQAFQIDLIWQSKNGEPINNDYFYVKSVSGEQYHFLRRTIGGKGVNEEQYIYIVPTGDNPNNYTVEVHPLLKEKYKIIIE